MILAFSLVAALLTLTPGVDTALVLRTTLGSGRRAGILTAAGISSGVIVWGAASAVGLSALVQASPTAYDVLRYAGGAYLVYLGVRAFRHSDQTEPTVVAYQAFRTGLTTNLLNPKVGVFYATLLPQFVPADSNVLLMSLLLACIHATMGIVWLSGVAQLAERASAALRKDAWRRRLERITGAALLGFGAKVLV